MINHLWQSTIFAVAIGLLTLALRKNRASIRHWLWFAGSVKFLIPLSLLMSLGQQAQRSAPPIAFPIATAAGQLTAPFPETLDFTSTTTQQHFDWSPYILAVWAIGFLAIAFMRFRGWLRIRAILCLSAPSSLQLPVEARFTTGLLGPGIVGIWKPVLLLPAGIEQHLTPEQFSTAITHELAHVHRRDNLLAAIHMLVEAIFWFHPLVWWIGTRLVEERELACDEAVIAQGGNPRDYAEAILGVCKHYVEPPVACVSGVTGADIKKRLEAILTPRNILGLDWSRKLLLVATALVAAMVPFLAGIASAQSNKFEVASVRLADPNAPAPAGGKSKGGGGGGGIRSELDDGRFATSDNVYNYILKAFKLPSCLEVIRGDDCPFLTGGPAWIRRDSYNIQATLPAGTPPYSYANYIEGQATEVYAMLDALLRERFQLKIHHEMREVPVFLLTVAKNGHKMTPTAEPNKQEKGPDGSLRIPRTFAFSPFAGPNGVRNLHLTVRNWSMDLAVDVLTRITNRPVLNRTNLEGFFDFNMEYAADPDLGPNSRIGAELTGPEFFTALQEQAGLRLESTKEKVDVIVIDSIERPSEN